MTWRWPAVSASGGTGPSGPKVPALQQQIHTMFPGRGQGLWALNGDSAAVLLNRATQGGPLQHELGSATQRVQDIVPGDTCQFAIGGPSTNPAHFRNNLIVADTEFVYENGFTILMRVCLSQGEVAIERFVQGCGIWASGHVDWAVSVVPSGGLNVLKFQGSGANVTGTHGLPDGFQETIMIRRQGDGLGGARVRLTVGDIANTDEFTGLPPAFAAVGGESWGLGFIPDGGTASWIGAMADVGNFAGDIYSDAEYTTQRNRMLGL